MKGNVNKVAKHSKLAKSKQQDVEESAHWHVDQEVDDMVNEFTCLMLQ